MSRGINANVIAPGMIETKMTDSMTEEAKKMWFESIPMGRLGKPSDVANAALFLASDLSSYITGQVLNIDGGIVM